MTQIPHLMPALPEISLSLMAMALLMVGVFHKDSGGDGVAPARLVSFLGVAALVIGLVMVVAVTSDRMLTFAGMFVVDPFAGFFKILVLIASGVAIIISRGYLERHGIAKFEFTVLILLATVGMMMMISANDLISLYLGLEMQSLALYVMAAFQRDETRSTEAGLKYFVLGALASGMLLYGSSLVYGFVGSTSFDVLAQTIHGAGSPAVGLVVGVVFILAGLAFKVSAVPFHMWTPDVYEGAPTPVTAFFSVGPKIAAMALFVRVLVGPFGDLADQWQQIVVFVSMASMVLGAFAAINQRNIKRLMAYSSIGHVGYALIGLAVGSEIGVRGIMIYMAIYLVMNLGAFTCILCMVQGGRMVEGIDDLAGLSKSHPMVAMAMAVFMFSMSGIPPLAGFFGKFYIFLAAIESGLYALAVIGVLSSVVAAFYYLRIIKVMYFDEAEEPLDKPIGRDIGVVLVVSTLAIVFFFALPSTVLSSAASAAAALFAG